jgi:hypothetical protein
VETQGERGRVLILASGVERILGRISLGGDGGAVGVPQASLRLCVRASLLLSGNKRLIRRSWSFFMELAPCVYTARLNRADDDEVARPTSTASDTKPHCATLSRSLFTETCL